MTDEDLVPLLIEVGRAGLPDPVSSTAGVAVGLLRDHAPRASLRSGCRGSPPVRWRSASVSKGPATSPAARRSVDVFMLCRPRRGAPGPTERGRADAGRVGGRRPPPVPVAWTPSDGDACGRWAPRRRVGIRRGQRGVRPCGARRSGDARRARQRMLDMAVEYASEREQFGVPIGSFQAVKHHWRTPRSRSSSPNRSCCVRPTRWPTGPRRPRCTSRWPRPRPPRRRRRGAAALQVHGAIGYTVEYDLHLYMKRAWALAARYGDAAFHRRRVRTAVLGGLRRRARPACSG
jgi:hypothetical protein